MGKGEDELRRLLEEAVRAARDAGKVLLKRRGQAAVRYKTGHKDLVTAADVEAEAVIVSALRSASAKDAVIGEESGQWRSGDGGRWLIDPIDGTTNYAQGLPMFGTAIALERDGRLLVGVIHMPHLDVTYTAARGLGAWRNGVPMQVSRRTRLEEIMVATGFGDLEPDRRRQHLEFIGRLSHETRGVRLFGSAAVHFVCVAEGLLDAYWAPNIEPWDVAAGVLLVEEAGGRASNMGGGELDLNRGDVLATNGRVHEQLLTMLREIHGPR